jgi:hypothetical protein
MTLHADIRRSGYGVITCAEPGCTNRIEYFSVDKEVPLYCEQHRTEEGRHSAKRKLR